MNIFKIFTDGASRGNPGPSGIGITFYLNSNLVFNSGYFVGLFLTNNIAEYLALLCALKIFVKDFLLKQKFDELHIFADSQLVIKQLNKIYKIKNEKLIPLFESINQELNKIEKEKKLSYIPRENNKEADKMANFGIDKKNLLPEWLAKEIPLFGDKKI